MVSANPGGQHRRLIRHTVKAWLDAQQIEGIGHIHPGMKPDIDFDEHPESSPDTACIVRIALPDTTEDRSAYTGWDDRGGKLSRYQCELHVHHRQLDRDEFDEAEDDYDRIIDALKDALRGRGRDLGRPDVVLTSGESPAETTIRDAHADPVETDEGFYDRRGVISFEVLHYLQSA